MTKIKNIILLCLVFLTLSFTAEAGFLNRNVIRDIPYTESATKEQKLDIYLPSIKANSPLPVHIYVHGGAWSMGDKSSVRRNHARQYTKKGVIFISVNYRLAPDSKYPSNIKDLASMALWVSKNIHKYGGDPKRVVLSGHSAGAHLVSLLATNTKFLEDGGVDGNFFKSIYAVDTASFDLTQSTEGGNLSRIVNRMKTNSFGRNPLILKEASPMFNVQQSERLSSFYLFVTSSRPDAVQETRAFYKILKARGQEASMGILSADLSHSDMNDQIFDTASVIYKSIMKDLSSK